MLKAWAQLRPAVETLPAGEISALRVTERSDWYVTLHNGMELVTDQAPGQGLPVRIVPSLGHILGERLTQVERIDMRYGHGFAVRWRAQANVQEGNGAS